MLNDHGVTAVVPVDRYLWLNDIEPFENLLNESINVVSFHLAIQFEKRLSLNSKLWKLAHLFIEFEKSGWREKTESERWNVQYRLLWGIEDCHCKHDKG